jgi:hypothetical protein
MDDRFGVDSGRSKLNSLSLAAKRPHSSRSVRLSAIPKPVVVRAGNGIYRVGIEAQRMTSSGIPILRQAIREAQNQVDMSAL